MKTFWIWVLTIMIYLIGAGCAVYNIKYSEGFGVGFWLSTVGSQLLLVPSILKIHELFTRVLDK